MLFGRFLIEKNRITQTELEKALEKQNIEKISNKPRMLGSILLYDFKTFIDRIELQRFLEEFEQYKEQIEKMYEDAKKYGIDPRDKLEIEYADLLEELETDETIKIRELIRRIENVRIEIKNGKNSQKLEKEREINYRLLQDNNNFHDKIKRQKIEIKSLENDKLAMENKMKRLQHILKQYVELYGDITKGKNYQC